MNRPVASSETGGGGSSTLKVELIILNIFNLFQSVRGIKNGILIGRRNDITANMAALALCTEVEITVGHRSISECFS